MKQVTIEAYDKAGVLLGTQTEDQPETLAELVDQFEDADIVALAWRSHVIDVQRELRANARGPKAKTPAELAFAKLTPAQQAELMAKLQG